MHAALQERGDHYMDTRQQLRTYHGFLIGLRYMVLHLIVVISFLVLAFCTGAGVPGGAFVALILLAVGLYFAKDRKKVTWTSQAATLVMTTAAEAGHPVEDQLRAAGSPLPDEALPLS